MSTRTLLSILGAAFLLSAAPVVAGAARPGAAPTSTKSSTKKKTSARRSKKKSKVKAQTAPTPDRIREIQTALQREGAYNGEPTGKWDDTTVEAMKSYQDKNGLSPTGKLDALTLEKLGLGSRTAGRGAPTSPASSSPATPPTTIPVPASTASPADPPAKQ